MSLDSFASQEIMKHRGIEVDMSQCQGLLDEDGDEEEEEEEEKDDSWDDEEGESDSNGEDIIIFEIRKTPGKGFGAFARKDIPRGTRLISEKPLLEVVTDDDNNFKPEPTFELWKKLPKSKQVEYASLHPSERMRQTILSKLIPRGKEGMPFVVANVIANLGAIYAANGFGPAVYKSASRFNHSCTPNCNQSPSDVTGEMGIHTVRDIKAGEELTVYYVDPEQPQEARQRRLDDYEFLCKCSACGLTTPEGIRGEKRRAQMWRLKQDIEFLEERLGLNGYRGIKGPFAPSVSTKKGNPDPESALRVLESLCKKEGLVGNNLTDW
jgi:hypothetical protein